MTDTTSPEHQADPSLLLIKSELARHLRCSERQIDKLTEQGRIPLPIMLGSVRRWPRSVVIEWIDQIIQSIDPGSRLRESGRGGASGGS